MKQSLICIAALVMTVMAWGTSKPIVVANEDNSFTVSQKSFDGFRFGSMLAQFELGSVFMEDGQYTTLTASGYMRDFALPGYPELPVVTRLIEIPEGAEVEINIISTRVENISTGAEGYPWPIAPSQPSIFKSQDPADLPFVKVSGAYTTNAFNEQKLVRVEEIGRMRGVRIARLICSPFRYNPVSGVLEVTTSIEAEVVFRGADEALTRDLRRKYYSPYHETTFNALINHNREILDDTNEIYPVKYVIVSSPLFQAALQPFVAWKRKMGFNVIEAYTNNPLVGTTTTSIKTYLQGLYAAASFTDPAPTFVLLVGDVAQIPAYSGTTGSHPSDLYYFEYDGGGDYLPELFYGRFSANNLTQLQPQIDKTLEYEQYLMPNTAYLGEVVMVAGMDNSFGPVHANGQINYGTANYFNAAHNMLSHTYLYPSSGSSASAIISKISSGVGFVNYTAHCGTNGWADPSFTSSNIPSLQNTSEYPLIIGNCCLSNKYDGDCFGEDLLRASGKGALGYIGGSNSTLWDEDYYWSVGVGTPTANPTYAGTGLGAYDRLFHDHGEPRSEWYETNGQIITAGNLAVTASASNEDKYYWEIYHLMGDPALRAYYGVPQALTITHPPMLPVAIPGISISTEPNTYVGISYNGTLHGAGLSDSLGSLYIPLIPMTIPGYAHIVATKMNRQPYIDSIIVVVPNGPYLGLNSFSANDSIGNNNGKVDYGESILLDFILENYGNQDAGQVTAVISTLDSLVSITDSTENVNLVTAGNTMGATAAFAFTVDNYIPDQHPVTFTLSLSDSAGGAWSYNFNVMLNAPSIKIISMTIDDATSGNGNGSIDPGETADVTVTVANTGHCDAPAPALSLYSYSPLVNIPLGLVMMNTLAQGGTQSQSFQLNVSAAALPGDVFEVHTHAWSGLYGAQQSFAPVIGSMVEDWETGSFNKYAWVPGGSQPWTVTNSLPWQGTYCAASGTIGHSANSSLEVQISVLMNDTISFYRKVSSEAGYDFLIFSIDGNPVDQWSGNVSWSQVAYPVTPGQHTFNWTYEKDWYAVSGSDKAWIDNIEFPALAGIATETKETNLAAGLNVFPNPARDIIRVTAYLPEAQDLHIRLLDGSGRILVTLNEGRSSAGYHSYPLDTRELQGGMYLLQMECGTERLVRKVVLIR